VTRVFLLSPAHCGGERARSLLNERAQFDLAQRVRGEGGAPLGEVFSFMSGLYFRGKLAYASAFASPPRRVAGVQVITSSDGLCDVGEAVDLARLRRFATVDIGAGDGAFRDALGRDARMLARAAGDDCEVVLLGSIATGKYVEPLLAALGTRLRFPSAFVGRGDMSRGGLLLRCVRAGVELDYVGIADVPRRGARPGRLEPLR
jgi:hypothetical protein